MNYDDKIYQIKRWLNDICEEFPIDYTIYEDSSNKKELGVAVSFLDTDQRVDIHSDIDMTWKLLESWFSINGV